MTGGKSHLKFFFPLCGKTKDMLWIYQQGHDVVGVEAVTEAVRQFFEESEIDFTVEKCSQVDGWVFKSHDGRIRIFACDLFKITPEVIGPIDCVFDRGSYVAIERESRKQ